MKTATATTVLYISVECPYCDAYQTPDLREHLDNGELSAEECDAEIECEECNKKFIVDQITY